MQTKTAPALRLPIDQITVSAEPEKLESSRLDGSNQLTIRLGQEAWSRIRSDLNWEDWIAIGRAHVIGRTEAMHEAHVNEPAGHRYKEAFSEWLERFGFDNLDKGDRSRLFEVMDHLSQIEIWRARLTTTERLRLNHPSTVLRKWKSATQLPKPESKLSPMAKAKESIIALSEENERLKCQIAKADGGTITAKDTAKDAAGVLFRTFSESKFEEIVREGRKQYKAKRRGEP